MEKIYLPNDEIDEWKIAVAKADFLPHSPSEAAGAVEKVARQYGLSIPEAAFYYSDDLDTYSDPLVLRSLRELSEGNTVVIRPGTKANDASDLSDGEA